MHSKDIKKYTKQNKTQLGVIMRGQVYRPVRQITKRQDRGGDRNQNNNNKSTWLDTQGKVIKD